MSRSFATRFATALERPHLVHLALAGGMWALFCTTGALAYLMLRWRFTPPIPLDRLLLALGIDVLLALALGYVLHRRARAWAERGLTAPQALRRLGFLSVGFLTLVYAMMLIAQAIQLGSLSAAAGALPRSWATVALDYGFFWAIALTTVPLPFLRRLGRGRTAPGPQAVVVRSVGSIEHVPLLQILALTAMENYVELHLGSRRVLHRATMAEMEAQLSPQGFVRVHRSAIVRRDAVTALHRPSSQTLELELRNGLRVPVSRRYRAATRHWE
jgi:hypothetical protein